MKIKTFVNHDDYTINNFMKDIKVINVAISSYVLNCTTPTGISNKPQHIVTVLYED